MAVVKSVASKVKEFVEFALGVFLGMLVSFTTEIEAFLFGVAAVMVSFEPTRPAGLVLLLFATLRVLGFMVNDAVRASKGGSSSG
jgi:hypothetical protein